MNGGGTAALRKEEKDLAQIVKSSYKREMDGCKGIYR
jgi:hypothetical protein